MAETTGMAEIRGLDIDKTVKGFALTEYIFKNDCTVSNTTSDSIRWYQETATDLTTTTPTSNANVSPLAVFPTLEASWTRNTSYVKKYASESFLTMEDIKGADIDVLARTLLRLTRSVTKQVDSRIWDVISESRSAVNINSGASTAAWDAGSGQDPIKDILTMKKALFDNGYNPSNAVLYLSSTDYKNFVTWLISTKGSSIPQFASDKVQNGEVMNILGVRVKVSTNVTADYALMCIPQVSCTWKQHTAITSRVIEDAGLGSKVRVWELGEAILTDPKSVYLLTNTQA